MLFDQLYYISQLKRDNYFNVKLKHSLFFLKYYKTSYNLQETNFRVDYHQEAVIKSSLTYPFLHSKKPYPTNYDWYIFYGQLSNHI